MIAGNTLSEDTTSSCGFRLYRKDEAHKADAIYDYS